MRSDWHNKTDFNVLIQNAILISEEIYYAFQTITTTDHFFYTFYINRRMERIDK